MGKIKDAAIRRACELNPGPLADQIIKIMNMGETGLAKEIFLNNPNDERHGTNLGYQYGCRCVRCIEAHSTVRRRERREFRLNTGDPRHGTRTGYSSYGCRCEKCLSWHNFVKE